MVNRLTDAEMMILEAKITIIRQIKDILTRSKEYLSEITIQHLLNFAEQLKNECSIMRNEETIRKQQFERNLSFLSEQEQRIYTMRYDWGLTVKEIAEKMNCSERTVFRFFAAIFEKELEHDE